MEPLSTASDGPTGSAVDLFQIQRDIKMSKSDFEAVSSYFDAIYTLNSHSTHGTTYKCKRRNLRKQMTCPCIVKLEWNAVGDSVRCITSSSPASSLLTQISNTKTAMHMSKPEFDAVWNFLEKCYTPSIEQIRMDE
jgi:hypothetical protein